MEDYCKIIHFIPPASFWNILPSGAIQEVRGSFGKDGLWLPRIDIFYVSLPLNDEGQTIDKTCPMELAVTVCWKKVYELLLKNKIDPEIIKKDDWGILFSSLGMLTPQGVLKDEYQMNYKTEIVNNEVIDITNTANPREVKK